MAENIVIVGGGHGAVMTALNSRKLGFKGAIIIVGEEDEIPYQRPPLSKGYLLGETVRKRLQVRHPDVLAENQIELLTGVRVTGIDRNAKQLSLEAGEPVAYDKLVIATGARPRLLDVPGADLDGIHTIRSLADVDALREELPSAVNCIIIGAGFIGLEAAAVLRKLDKKVTVLEAAGNMMGRSVSSEVATFFQSAHESRGVVFQFNCFATAFQGKAGRVRAVETKDGRTWPAELAILGIGILANDELAKASGLATDRGILVDEYCRTEDSSIYAIGDCTRHRNLRYQGHISLESVQNAVDQAKVVAAAIAGEAKPYRDLPWFWSDQYDMKLQIAGLSQGSDETMIYDDGRESGKLGICHFKAGELIAVETVNRAADHIAAQRLLASGKPVRREDLSGESSSLKAMAGF